MKKYIYGVVALLFLLNVGVAGALAAGTQIEPRVKPDSFWYTFHRLGEKINLIITFSDSKKAKLLNENSKERIVEVQYLMDKKKYDKAKQIMKDFVDTNKQAKELTQKVLKDKNADINLVTQLKTEVKNTDKDIAPVLKEINEEATVENQTDIKDGAKEAIEKIQNNDIDKKDQNNSNVQEKNSNVQEKDKDDQDKNNKNAQDNNIDKKDLNNTQIQEKNKDDRDKSDNNTQVNKVDKEENNSNPQSNN